MYSFLSLKYIPYIIKGDRLLLCICPFFFNSIAKILLTEGRDDERKRWIA